jgi:hypothetical protein
MGTLQTFFTAHKLSTTQVARISSTLESRDAAGKTLMVKRAAKRRNKETAAKKYAELDIAKPKTLGRGISEAQVSAALGDKEVSKRARTKILRAVNHILVAKKQAAVEMKVLFEGSKAKAGKSAKAEKKA